MQLLDLLHSIPVLAQAEAQLKPNQTLMLCGVPSPAWAVVAADLQKRSERVLLLIAPSEETAENTTNDLRAILENEGDESVRVLWYPAPDRDRAGENTEHNPATPQRLAALEALHAASRSEEKTPLIIVCTVTALASPTLPPDIAQSGYDEISVSQTLQREAFIEHLAATGYERVDQVEAPGQFAARGGLIDFFAPAEDEPLRVELFGEEIDSLRYFDVDTQRSINKIPSFRLSSPREVFLTAQSGAPVAEELRARLGEQTDRLRKSHEEETAAKLENRITRDIERLEQGVYFPDLDLYAPLLYPQMPTLLDHLPAHSIVVWADPERAENHLERVREDWLAANERGAETGETLRLPIALAAFEELREGSCKYLQTEIHVGHSEAGENLAVHLPPSFSGKLDTFIEHVGSWTRRGRKLVISTSHARRVREILADGDVRHVHLLDAINEVEEGAILILPQRLTAGFSLGDLLVLTDSEIFGWQPTQSQLNTKRRGKKREKKWSEKSSALSDLSALREGDFVVHINHGIARYGGVTRREVAGALNDYLQLEYDGEDRLYVPVGQLDRVQKYLRPRRGRAAA